MKQRADEPDSAQDTALRSGSADRATEIHAESEKPGHSAVFRAAGNSPSTGSFRRCHGIVPVLIESREKL
jgi:hypothetical protein